MATRIVWVGWGNYTWIKLSGASVELMKCNITTSMPWTSWIRLPWTWDLECKWCYYLIYCGATLSGPSRNHLLSKRWKISPNMNPSTSQPSALGDSLRENSDSTVIFQNYRPFCRSKFVHSNKKKSYFVIKNKEAVRDGFLLGRSPPKRTKSKSVLLLEFIKQWGRGYFFLYFQNWIGRIQGKMESGAKLGSSKSRRRTRRVERLYHFAYLSSIVSEHWFWWAKFFGNYRKHELSVLFEIFRLVLW